MKHLELLELVNVRRFLQVNGKTSSFTAAIAVAVTAETIIPSSESLKSFSSLSYAYYDPCTLGCKE